MIISHLFTDRLFEPHTAAEWKLNMLAVSSQKPLLLVAKSRNVLVYKIDHYTRTPVYLTQIEYPWPSQMDEINAIALGKLHDDEVLVAVYDSGRTAAWRLSEDIDILWKRSTGVSTWGCAVNCTQDIVATSSNSHNIDVLYPKAQNPRSNSPEESSEISLDPEVHEFNGNVDVLRGHGHNVPNIAFSAGGGYIASASIDQTVRVWSLERKEPIFTFSYVQWCWSVLFIYPLFFMPSYMDKEPEHQQTFSHKTEHGSDEHYISDLEGRQIEADDLDEAGGEGEEDDGNHAADDEERVGAALLYDEMPDETSSSDSAELDTNRYNQQLPTEHAIDHETDIQNGYINTGENASVISEFGTHEHRSTLSPEIGMRSEDSAPAENSQLRIRAESDFIQEDTDPSQSPALLLCGTKSDLLLLDPSNAESPIVDKIEYVVSRTPMPTLMDMLAFDRVTFLEWVPELAVAVVGALTGVVSIVRFECTPSGDGAPRYKMRVLAYIPAKSHASPLYGISVYRKHVDCSQFPSVVLYLLYVDGDLAAHEMRLPPLNLTESLFPH